MYVNTNSKGNQNHEIKTKIYTFSLASDIDVEKSCFLKNPYQQFLTLLSFTQFYTFSEAAARRCSSK